MGAVVEVLGSALHSLSVFTDENGFYTADGLLPGVYSLRVSAPTFLTQQRERVGVRAGSKVTVNLTLATLFDALQLVPARAGADDDDWKWVLRSGANRPVLRMLDDGSLLLTTENHSGRELKGTVSFLAGSPSDGYGSASDMSTTFSLEKSIFSSGTVSFQGNVGYGDAAAPTTVVRASYSHKLLNGSEPQVSLTMRRLAAPEMGIRDAGLQALALNSSDNLVLGDVLEFTFGSELQTIQFLGHLQAFRPYGSADLHLSPNTVLEYRYATSQPEGSAEKGFEAAPADLSESGPRVSMAGFTTSLERAGHHEVSFSRRFGKTNLQFAVYSDRVENPALTGVGEVTGDGGNVLPDVYSGTFTYQGKDLAARGMRVVLQKKMASDLTATLDYEYGGVLDLAREDVSLQDARSAMTVRNRHSLAAKVSGTVPVTKTRWIASYRWTGGRALTPVDMFNASPGQSDPFLNVFVRQPIPGTGFLPGHMDALVDLRNLLAQGYVPVLGQDGQTVYLVQSARAIRGGLAFTF
jgi:Carboxypeptidase regulatory-like domain